MTLESTLVAKTGKTPPATVATTPPATSVTTPTAMATTPTAMATTPTAMATTPPAMATTPTAMSPATAPSPATTAADEDEGDVERALAPVGTVLLVALAVILAAGVGAATLGGPTLQDPAPAASLSLSLSADGTELTIRHLAGDSLDVESLRLDVTVDGDPLAHQPPVPFFSATGFRPGPTGAFNVAGDTTLSPGEAASFEIASTNDPVPAAGNSVEVTVYSDGYRIARLTGTL